jgi:hypothetical protein
MNKTNGKLKNAPLFWGAVFLLVVVALLEKVTLHKTNGVFCYPLDDTFIHMAVAKNMALHGNWGITATDWVSTSSSPFFTILLTVMFKLFGISVYFPFVLGVAGALLLIVAMQRELNRYTNLSTLAQSTCIILTLFLGAIPSLAALGMEHTFQVAFTLFFVHSCADIFINDKIDYKQVWIAAVWGALMVSTRYENALVVAAVCGLLLLNKGIRAPLVIGIVSALPILLFGLYAVSNGGLFIPNSIQIKVRDNYKQLLNGGIAMLEVAASISGLIAISIFVILKKLREQRIDRTYHILAIFVLSALMHSVFGGFGWFYRYEAYLIVLGSFHLLILFFDWYKVRKLETNRLYLLYIAVALLFTFNLPLRGGNALRNFVRSTYNIYEQQYQMALFTKKYYDKETIAANDIGAMSFLTDMKIIDLWGLGNNEVTLARKHGNWNPAFLQSLVTRKKASIAIVYESWFTNELTGNWKKIGTWEVSYSFMLGDTKVTFYVTDPTDTEGIARLKSNLNAFRSELPKDVRVEVVN